MENFPSNTDIEIKTWKRSNMKPERIAEIAEKVVNRVLFADVPAVRNRIIDAIKEALEEENRWFYPEKGELPEK